MPLVKTWIHPADDERCDSTVYRNLNEKDPRAISAGPCADMHLLEHGGSKAHPGGMLFNGNQAAHWVDCATCGLRLGTYPFKGHSGKFIVEVHPTIVEQALDRIMKMNKWNECNKKLVDGMIMIITGERQVESAAASPSSTSTQKPKVITAKSQEQPPISVSVLEGPGHEMLSGSIIDTMHALEVENFILVTCQICNEEGHGAKECPDLQAHLVQEHPE